MSRFVSFGISKLLIVPSGSGGGQMNTKTQFLGVPLQPFSVKAHPAARPETPDYLISTTSDVEAVRHNHWVQSRGRCENVPLPIRAMRLVRWFLPAFWRSPLRWAKLRGL